MSYSPRFHTPVPAAVGGGRFRTFLSLCGATIAAAAALSGCGTPPNQPPPVVRAPAVEFRDVTAEAGIRFRHQNGAAGRRFLPETMGAGCAFLDYDNDGRQDVLLLNGTMLAGATASRGNTIALYRNTGSGVFVEVSRATGLYSGLYAMGVAVGDYDNDGWDDLYITGVGAARLYHNEPAAQGRTASIGGRRFRDVTTHAGVESPGWSTSATWFDYDRDGKLDLFVCHYVRWRPGIDPFYAVDGVHRSYATPEQYASEPCRLYHNAGDGRFKDVTRQAGIYSPHSKALGVVAFDFDQDGWTDLVVTNDTEPNFLFHNQGNRTFREVALETGVAVAETGKAKAGMGVDVGDDANTGQDSIVITNFAGEQLTLYRRDPSGHYLDVAAQSGIGNASQLYLGFGTLFTDYDADGQLDIFVANGHIQEDVAVRQTGVLYQEPALLFHNEGEGRYQDRTVSAGAALMQPAVSRGAAQGDFDNDGYPDLLMTANNGAARLLRNVNRTGHHWLRLRLEGVQSNRNGYGARVRVRAGARTLSLTVKAASSYLSQSDRRVLFGLGGAARVDSVDIQWPSGRVQPLGPTPVDRTLFVREGEPARTEVDAR